MKKEAKDEKGIQGKDGEGVEVKVKGGEHMRLIMRRNLEIDNHKRYKE